MNNLEKRIENLEKHTGVRKKSVVIVIVTDGDTTQWTKEQEEAAIADYRAKNPEREEDEIISLEWYEGKFKPAETPQIKNREGVTNA